MGRDRRAERERERQREKARKKEETNEKKRKKGKERQIILIAIVLQETPPSAAHGVPGKSFTTLHTGASKQRPLPPLRQVPSGAPRSVLAKPCPRWRAAPRCGGAAAGSAPSLPSSLRPPCPLSVPLVA
eukprot:47420-Rhodomonas_salina.1